MLYNVFNGTDGFFANHELMTKAEADQFIIDFPKRYAQQGYYRTGNGERIDPNDVELELREYKNDLMDILDFEKCREIVKAAMAKNPTENVILCGHYSINIGMKYKDGEALQDDLNDLEQFIGYPVLVSDFDDLIVEGATEEEEED